MVSSTGETETMRALKTTTNTATTNAVVTSIIRNSPQRKLINMMTANSWMYIEPVTYKDVDLLRFEKCTPYGDRYVAHVHAPLADREINENIERATSRCDVYDSNGDLAPEQCNSRYLDYALSL